jgi:hypothetical protein
MTDAATLSGSLKKRFPEKVGHCRALQMMRHQARPAAQDTPGQQRADQRVADADPGRRKTILPAELAGIADKNDSGKIRGAKGKSRKPGADIAAAEHETLNIRCGPAAIDADADHHGKEQDEKDTLD